jgi:hypothetical protein
MTDTYLALRADKFISNGRSTWRPSSRICASGRPATASWSALPADDLGGDIAALAQSVRDDGGVNGAGRRLNTAIVGRIALLRRYPWQISPNDPKQAPSMRTRVVDCELWALC